MLDAMSNSLERVAVIIKAAPHASAHHGETVCCAGVTADGQWRRLYPVRFRHLSGEKQFKRWDWVSYKWRTPKDDRRTESRRLQEDSLRLDGTVSSASRAALIEAAIVPCLETAIAAGSTLAIIRPHPGSFQLSWKRKTPLRIGRERAAAHGRLLQQSFFEKQPKPLEPCPYEFRAIFSDGKQTYERKCGDWETEAMYWNLSKTMSEAAVLSRMNEVFNCDYPRQGMALALGNMKRNPSVWMLLGIVRVDEPPPRLL